ncbi:MAG: hypothetical protein IKQ56_06610 [Lachnospiraceae bacterium]|nr:hypothetical protein [Lachnospiraceae bacterium]
MSILDALSRIPKIVESNVNAAIHKDTSVKPVNPQEIELKASDVRIKETNTMKANDTRSKDIAAAVSDLEKELIASNSVEKQQQVAGALQKTGHTE